MRKFLTSFEIISQSAGPIGKPNHLVHWVQFVGMIVWVLCFVCIGSWSFGVRISLCLSCWIPDFVRKAVKIFEIFSQSDGLVGKPNHPVHWVQFARKAVWVLCFVCIGSWSFGVVITLSLSCWIPQFVSKVLKVF